MSSDLETRIGEQHKDLKLQNIRCVVLGKPFQYMINLSKVGERRYNVRARDSFWYGVDKSLDWYNTHKKHDYDLSTEVYALKQGCEHILRYIFEEYKPLESEEEE